MSEAPERIWIRTPVAKGFQIRSVCDDERDAVIHQMNAEYIRADIFKAVLKRAQTYEKHCQEKAQRIEQQNKRIAELENKLAFVGRQLDDIAIEGTVPTAVRNVCEQTNE